MAAHLAHIGRGSSLAHFRPISLSYLGGVAQGDGPIDMGPVD